VASENILDRAAIGNHVALELPCAAQGVLEQKLVGAGRLTVGAVVGAHDRSCVTLDNGRPERRQIRVFLVMAADIDIREVPGRLRPTVDGEMLRRGNGKVVLRVISLQPGHEGHRQPAAQVGIFAVGLLPPPPARVAEDVDVGRPEIQAFENVGMTIRLGLDVLDPAFDANDIRHIVNGCRIECRGQPDRLRKFRCTVPGNAVEGLAPPVIGGYSEPLDRASLIDQLRGLLLQGHPVNEVRRSLLEGELRIEIGGVFGGLPCRCR